MKKKDIIFNKFGGLCVYTGKPLGTDWQIDHMKSKHSFEQILISEKHYINSNTNQIISFDEYNQNPELYSKRRGLENGWFSYVPARYKPHPDVNKIENLVPAIKIINHYKRESDLEGFREKMKYFHLRLAKLPKKTQVEATKKRIIYMNTIADLFGITTEKPFSGSFYFETI